MKTPRILAVIPTLGERPDWLRNTVQSFIEQDDVKLNLRVVSPDSEIVSSICEEAGITHVVCNRKGLSVAINEGWDCETESEFVTWLGDDDLLAPNSLSVAARALLHAPKASMVYGQARYIDRSGETLWVQRPGRFAAAYLSVGKNLIPQPGSLLRKSAVRAVGGLNEQLSSAMDQDLFVRLQSVGKLEYVPQELAAFRLHEHSITVTKGATGGGESEAIRRRSSGKLYGAIRPITRLTDRLIYAVIRRLPSPSVPQNRLGKPYIPHN